MAIAVLQPHPHHRWAHLRTSHTLLLPTLPVLSTYLTCIFCVFHGLPAALTVSFASVGRDLVCLVYRERPGVNAVPACRTCSVNKCLRVEGSTSLQVTASMWLQICGSLYP